MRRNNETIGELDGQGNDRGVGANGGVDGVPNFSTIIAQQLQNLLPTLLAQVGSQGSNQGNGWNQNGDAVNDNIQGDVRNVIANNGRRGCTYKEFLACNPKEYDGKGGAIVYTRWIEKMESVQDMSGCGDNQKIVPSRMMTRSAGRSTDAPRGGGTSRRVGRGARRTREPVRRNNETIGELEGQGNDQGVEANGGVNGVPDFSTIIAQQLQNLLPTILAQVGNQGNNQGNNRNQNGNSVNDNIQGDVRNVIMNNDRRGCTYKEFLACNPKVYDGKGGAIVYTCWIEKMESV
ncbi:hypothetical protein Tco_0645411 [Tanacetum coccineum]